MNPKEKAAELLMKFQNVEALKDFGGMDFGIANQCAIIAVDEIIGYCRRMEPPINVDYWQKVRTELDNL